MRILDVAHSDVWGPAQTATFGGCRYYVLFIETSPGTPGSSRCGKRAKCSDTSKGLKTKSKKPLVDMYDACDRMAARSNSVQRTIYGMCVCVCERKRERVERVETQGVETQGVETQRIEYAS